MLGLLAPAVGSPATARADEMDIALSRLRIKAEPGSTCSPSTTDGTRDWCPDNNAWKRLASQLGMSMAPPMLTPARTVGPGGFHIGFETWITGLDSGQRYWRQGTEGDAAGAGEICDGAGDVVGCNRFVKSALSWSRLGVRKGFPAGLQLGASVGHAFSTEYWTWGVELQWAVFEGFRTEAWGFIPDLSVRGMVQTMTGEGEFNLTVPSLDFTLSKPLVFGDTVVITPHGGFQLLWIASESELVDLSPEVDAVARCMPESGPPGPDDVSAVRCSGDPDDFNNNAVFDDVRAFRYRLAFGLRFRYEMLTLDGSFMFDVKPPGEADGDVLLRDREDELPRQWTVAFGAGLQL